MTDEETAEIREALGRPSVRFDDAMYVLNQLVPKLLAENAVLREIAQSVAVSHIREESNTVWAIVTVEMVIQARALLGKGGAA